MSELSSSVQGAPLSLNDSINLHAATMMSICAALDEAGIVHHGQMATILARQVREDDPAPWACIVRAMAAALAQRAVDASQVDPHSSHDPTSPSRSGFVVLQGGRQGGDR